ncbi:symmetrical bis(5'-nucleosyl)-tetraphosphatase [Parathalassolituus penaei]|uniref:Bis(5'-nucleosyl)-tetraphosphatase, symmetrical n=1 Tax=Parathalassolituus penaei TaxID=2997323 RepID=A0A9X3IQI0_9GAMM|nr:symmetrical bis(5'-nucleosyl)-tetraphosphatase [Parathalassolituus penaei]MCY0963816.1 symmetrical bis(5'-nucleosyl)-tetraphosphatase [Parathalassolituus penaei]
MAIYAIGDIQGCFEPLQRLLNLIRFDPSHDQLWLAGDLVNRGPQSLEVLRWACDLGNRVTTVLGNHDLHLLARYYGSDRRSRGDTLDEVLAAPDCAELMWWLRQQPLVHHDEASGWCMVHAGLPPRWGPRKARRLAGEVEAILRSDQVEVFLAGMYGNKPDIWQKELQGIDRWRVIVNYLTRMRFIDVNGRLDLESKEGLDTAPPGFMPWFEAPDRKAESTRLIFGHWAALNGEVNLPNLFALDTGCVWGGQLTALRLDDQQRFSVAASPD